MKQRNRFFFHRLLSACLSLTLVLGLLCGCGGPERVTKETEETTLGIDVARYQGTIDWPSLERSGLDFVMIRLGYRSAADGAIKEDSNARYNLQEGSKTSLKLGAYFFSTAVSEEEAREEAQWVADFVAKYPITYPIAYDCENFTDPDSRQYGMTAEERTDVALAFLEVIEELGYEGMFYGSKYDLQSQWDTERIEAEYKIWVAQYPDVSFPSVLESSYEGTHQMWQYSKTGVAAGITPEVDLNVAYFGYDGIEPAKDSAPPEPAFPDPEALMDFRETSDTVTAKNATNLRSIPSQDTDSQVLLTLQNGQTAQRIAISDSGWSKLLFEGQVYYAVTSYLTTDLSYAPDSLPVQQSDSSGVQTQFQPTNIRVTAKELVNLRKLPSVEHEGAEVVAQLKHGEVVIQTGINEDVGWARVEYQGMTLYCVSSYLMPAD